MLTVNGETDNLDHCLAYKRSKVLMELLEQIDLGRVRDEALAKVIDGVIDLAERRLTQRRADGVR